MSYAGLWLTAYVNPRKFADRLAAAPAPSWGVLAALQRAAMDSLLTYLPVHLLGRTPPTPSYLSFIPTQRYYGALIFLGPVVMFVQLLLSASLIHVVLRLSGRRSDMDKLLNISGFTALAIGTVIVVWDGFWIIAGGLDQYAWGISHLLIDVWAVALAAIALRRTLEVPIWLGIALNVAAIVVSLPLAIMFMRAPS